MLYRRSVLATHRSLNIRPDAQRARFESAVGDAPPEIINVRLEQPDIL